MGPRMGESIGIDSLLGGWDAEGLFWGDAGTSDCGGRKWRYAARGGRGVCG